MQNEKPHAPYRYYVFSFFVVIALALVTFIPSSMVYRLRLFDAIGLPEWMAEIVRFVILAATPVAVLATGFVRIFAVSDREHAKAMTWAATLEGIGCVLEIIAALVNGSDIWALIGQAVTLGGSIAAVFFALVVTLTQNGFYKLSITENQTLLTFNKEFHDLLEASLKSKRSQETMQRYVDIMIKDKSEKMVGRIVADENKDESGSTGTEVPRQGGGWQTIAERVKGNGNSDPNR